MIWSRLRRHPLLVDLGLVVLLLLATIGSASRHHHAAAGIALGIVATLPLAWRRRKPVAVVAIVTAASLAAALVGAWLLPFQLGVALYTLATVPDDRLRRRVGAASIAAMAVALAVTGYGAPGDSAFHAVFLVPFTTGSIGTPAAA